MPNIHVMSRLQALLDFFRAMDSGGKTLSAAMKGLERELFIQHALSHIVAPPFRIGSGEITDLSGRRSGQLDVVIEYGNSVSFPLICSVQMPRLYLAEGVCAVIEIKSDLTRQWDEVLASWKKLQDMQRRYVDWISYGKMSDKIPYFVVGYRGWKLKETVEKKRSLAEIEGILVLDSEIFCGKSFQETGPASLYAFFMTLQEKTGSLVSFLSDYKAYACNIVNKGLSSV